MSAVKKSSLIPVSNFLTEIMTVFLWVHSYDFKTIVSAYVEKNYSMYIFLPQNKPMFIQFWNTYTNHAKINYKMLLTLRTPWWILLSSHAFTKNEPQAFNRSEWFFFLKIHKFGNRFTWKHVMKSLVTSIVNTAYLVTSLSTLFLLLLCIKVPWWYRKCSV